MKSLKVAEGGLGKRIIQKEEDVFEEQELGGVWGREDLGIHKEMGDSHGGLPGAAAEVEGAARLEDQASRCVG